MGTSFITNYFRLPEYYFAPSSKKERTQFYVKGLASGARLSAISRRFERALGMSFSPDEVAVPQPAPSLLSPLIIASANYVRHKCVLRYAVSLERGRCALYAILRT